MHTLREGTAYARCLGGHSLAPQSDAGSYRCELLSLLSCKVVADDYAVS